MLTFLAAFGIVSITCLIGYAIVTLSDAFRDLKDHERIINEHGSMIKANCQHFTFIENDLKSIHETILRLDLALQEINEKCDTDTERGGADD